MKGSLDQGVGILQALGVRVAWRPFTTGNASWMSDLELAADEGKTRRHFREVPGAEVGRNCVNAFAVPTAGQQKTERNWRIHGRSAT
jgi:hypothetical protein